MKVRTIPQAPGSPDGGRRAFDEAVKERLEVISGLRGSKIKLLDSTATTTDLINKVNELLQLLQ